MALCGDLLPLIGERNFTSSPIMPRSRQSNFVMLLTRLELN